MPLIGADPDPDRTAVNLSRQRQELQALLPDTPEGALQARHLQGQFGVDAVRLVHSWSPAERQPLSKVIPVCKGELRHGIQFEHARSVTDVLARRCRLAMVDEQEATRLSPLVHELLEIHTDSTATDREAALNLNH